MDSLFRSCQEIFQQYPAAAYLAGVLALVFLFRFLKAYLRVLLILLLISSAVYWIVKSTPPGTEISKESI